MAGRALLFPLILVLASPAAAYAQQSPDPASPPPLQLQVKNTTRVEVWQFFAPNAGGGNPDYAFPANRLFASLDFRGTRVDATAALQYVQFGGLPTNASGPGPFGTGPQYYAQSGSTDSHQIYVRLLQARFKNIVPHVSLQVGRFGYASGAESTSGEAKIEAVKRQRLDSRLIGEFEWSLYQRSFDGARADVDQARWHASASWFVPTQGGFDEHAGQSLQHVEVAAGTFSIKPNPILRHTDVQGFVYHYDDTRAVQARPDNTLLAASAIDVHITSLGTSIIGAYPVGPGQMDTLGWFVWQGGRWYGQRQAAGAAATEVGYQWTAARARPWLRAGWFRSSGDSDPTDNQHGTFFQMMPTTRRYSLSTVYNLMNSTEIFDQVLLRPRADLNLRLDVHRLWLTNAADLWYAGSGATARTGTAFGFAGRPSNGSTDLGVMVEGVADWTVTRHFSASTYLGRMRGGGVVTGTFNGARLLFGYVETVVSF